LPRQAPFGAFPIRNIKHSDQFTHAETHSSSPPG
jgi:hypothetical protein